MGPAESVWSLTRANLTTTYHHLTVNVLAVKLML